MAFASVVRMVSVASDSRNSFDFNRGLDCLVGRGSSAIFPAAQNWKVFRSGVTFICLLIINSDFFLLAGIATGSNSAIDK